MTGAATVTVRPATPDDWQLLRDVRLAALADAPEAFETTVAQARAFDEGHWRRRAAGSARSQLFLALAGREAVGMAGVELEDDGAAEIISMWVSPRHRRRGVARLLMEAAMARGRAMGASAYRLWTTKHNLPAEELYASLGFRLTDRWQALATARSGCERLWVRDLDRAPEVPGEA